MAGFKFDFNISDSDEGPTKTAPKKRRMSKRLFGTSSSSSASSSSEEESIVLKPETWLPKDLPAKRVPFRHLALSSGKTVIIYNGLKLLPIRQNLKIKDGTEDQEVKLAVDKAIQLLSYSCSENNLQWVEWDAISSIVTKVLPSVTSEGYEIKSFGAWRKYKINLRRYDRETNWYRLAEAVQIIGNEFEMCRKHAHKLLMRLFSRIFGTKIQAFSRERRLWMKAMKAKPIKLEKSGGNIKIIQ